MLRYKAIMVPMTYYSTSKKTAVMIVVLIWVLAFLIALPTAFFYQFTHIQDPSSGVKVKFIYPEIATKFCEIFTLLLTVCTVVKSKVKIPQNFVAFLEYMNFNFKMSL